MTVQRTVTMSDDYWQRIINASGEPPLDEDGQPIMSQTLWARKWAGSLITNGVKRVEAAKARQAHNQSQVPVTDSDFAIT